MTMQTSESAEGRELSPQTFARFARFITSEIGIKMPESRLTMLQSRIRRRVRDLRLNSVEEYSEYFFTSANAEERGHFIDAITTNKTDFFREPEHFDYLTNVVLPSLAAGGHRAKVWSAGCSSGEEPYTLAMVLKEFVLAHSGFDFAILGTDISTRMLDLATTAIYQESQIRPVPPELRRRYIWRSRANNQTLARVVPELRQTVTFHALNFMAADYRIRDIFDVIFLRNVLIYFDRSTQQAVINKICRNLAPGGYFFVGHSESLTSLDVPLSCVHTSIFRKRT